MFQKPGFKELKKDYTLVDMHVHSEYSHDCNTPVKNLLKKAKELGIGLAITDHARAEGALEACKQKRVLVIPGIEIPSFENKEILLYFYSAKDLKDYYEKYIKNNLVTHKPTRSRIKKTLRAVRSRMSMQEIINRAHIYKCIKCIPHPYTYLNRNSHLFFARKKRAALLKKIGAVEVLNSDHRRFMNKRALKWALKRNKVFIAGSDTHTLNGLGNAVVVSKAKTVKGFLDSIKNKKSFVIGKETKFPTAFRNSLKSFKHKRKEGWVKINKVNDLK
ncbi:PHP domain-containing protein [Candidatus Woesearchaeota archaeon]|nr:PHP domain-containing protein [Candidatus Woesearchaeota archaeon]